ncbi:hypothetical protein L600_001300000040 [Isoptericola variabilis J7]|nr:hypothetical protein L600_001300000040 [Isoptericola variabilis J7]
MTRARTAAAVRAFVVPDGGAHLRAGTAPGREGARAASSRHDLPGDDRREGEGEPDELHGTERLAEQHGPERRRDERREQAQHRHGPDRQTSDAAEPQRVRGEPAHEAEPRVPDQRAPVEHRRHALDEERQGEQHEAAGGEQPPGERERPDARRPRPALGERRAQGHGRRAGQARRDADRVETGGRAEHDEPDAQDADDAPREPPRRGRLAQQSDGERRDEQGLGGAERRGDPAGEALGGDEEQGEERPDVERAEDGGTPPPRAARQRAGDRDGQQPGGQRPDEAREEGVARGQELRGHHVRRAPDDRRERRGERETDGGGEGRGHATSVGRTRR